MFGWLDAFDDFSVLLFPRKIFFHHLLRFSLLKSVRNISRISSKEIIHPIISPENTDLILTSTAAHENYWNRIKISIY